MNQSLLTLLGMEKEAGTVDCCCLSVNVASLHEQILPLSTIVAWAAANKNQNGSRGQAGNQLKLAIAHGIWNLAFSIQGMMYNDHLTYVGEYLKVVR